MAEGAPAAKGADAVATPVVAAVVAKGEAGESLATPLPARAVQLSETGEGTGVDEKTPPAIPAPLPAAPLPAATPSLSGEGEGEQGEGNKVTPDSLKQVFCGGLAWATTSESLARYFSQFGEVIECEVIFDKKTNKSRGYGFVTFASVEAASRAIERPTPIIDGRETSLNFSFMGRKAPYRGGGKLNGATKSGRQQGPIYNQPVMVATPASESTHPQAFYGAALAGKEGQQHIGAAAPTSGVVMPSYTPVSVVPQNYYGAQPEVRPHRAEVGGRGGVEPGHRLQYGGAGVPNGGNATAAYVVGSTYAPQPAHVAQSFPAATPAVSAGHADMARVGPIQHSSGGYYTIAVPDSLVAAGQTLQVGVSGGVAGNEGVHVMPQVVYYQVPAQPVVAQAEAYPDVRYSHAGSYQSGGRGGAAHHAAPAAVVHPHLSATAQPVHAGQAIAVNPAPYASVQSVTTSMGGISLKHS